MNRWIRVGAWFIGLGQIASGLWAVVNPLSWFNDFPAGRGWVAAEGVYDRHLALDSGAGFLAVGVILVIAAIWDSVRAMQLAIIGYLINAVPHLLYHLTTTPQGLGTADRVVSVGALAFNVLLAVWMLGMTYRGSAVSD